MAYYNQYHPNYGYQQPTYNYQQNQTIQNGGFVTVQSEEEARSYPVAHGMSVTFRNENLPYIYTKTLGFSQMDSPTFEKYKLIKEEAQIQPEQPKDDALPIYVTKTELGAIREELDALRDKVEGLRKELGDE